METPYKIGPRAPGGRYPVDPLEASRNHAGVVHGGAWCFIAADVVGSEAQQGYGTAFRPSSLSIVFTGAVAGALEARVSIDGAGGDAVAVVDGISPDGLAFHAVLAGRLEAGEESPTLTVPSTGPRSASPPSGVPFRDFTGVHVERVDPDRLRSTWRPGEDAWRFVDTPVRIVALSALLVDSSGSLLNDVREVARAQFVTASLSVTALPRLDRAVLAMSSASSRLLKRGRRTAYCATSVADSEGDVVASGMVTYLLTEGARS